MTGNNVYLLWCKPRSNIDPDADLFLFKSRDGGITFAAAFMLTDNVDQCGNRDILVNGSGIHVIWLGRGVGGKPAILAKFSVDSGNTFFGERDVSQTGRRATQGEVAAIGSNVYITWQQDVATAGGGTSTDIFFARSTNRGVSYSPPVNLSLGNFNEESWLPAISAGDQYVHVLWQDAGTGSFDVFYRRSVDSGVTFQTYQLLPPGPANSDGEGDVQSVARGKDIYAAWIRRQGGQPKSDVYYYFKRSCPRMPSESGPFRCVSCCAVSAESKAIIVDGRGHRFGPLPTHFYMLTNPAGDDFYPLGAGAEVLFALFDTGVAEVFINNVLPNRVAANNFWDTDAGHLSISGIETAIVRLNGLSRRNSQGVPFAAQGQPNAAAAEVGGIALGSPVSPLNVTLLGTPVTNQIIARTDYTTEIVDTTFVRGPDIEFFMAGDADIPFSNLNLTLELFTPPGAGVGRTRADLPYLRNLRSNMPAQRSPTTNSFRIRSIFSTIPPQQSLLSVTQLHPGWV